MKINEVPQEKGALGDLKELYYATDQQGNYTTVLSSGWEAKNTALQASLSLIEEQIEEVKKQILAQEKSPIVFYMLKNRMDWSILADYMNSWQFLIKDTLNLLFSRNFLKKHYKNMLIFFKFQ